MNSSRIAAVALRQFYLVWKNWPRTMQLFVWVIVDIILWGFMTRYLNSIAQPGFNFVPALLGAVLLWDFLIRAMQGVAMSFLEDVWARNFLNVFASPLSIPEYVSGLVVASVATSMIGLAAMLLLATAAFGLSVFSYGLAIIAFLMILFLFGIALGIFACALVMRFGPAAEWFVWPIPALISPFVGVFYPLSVLPGWMQAVSHILPPAYVFEGVRGIVAGTGSVPNGALAAGFILAIIYVLLACWFFTSIWRYARRAGILARYSAENM